MCALDDKRQDRRRRRRRRIRGNNSAASGTETDTSVSNYRQDRAPRQPPSGRGGGANRNPVPAKSEDNAAVQSLPNHSGSGSSNPAGRNSQTNAYGAGGEDGLVKAVKSETQQQPPPQQQTPLPKDQRTLRRPASSQGKTGGSQMSGSDSDSKAMGKVSGNAPKVKEQLVNGE